MISKSGLEALILCTGLMIIEVLDLYCLMSMFVLRNFRGGAGVGGGAFLPVNAK